MRNAPRAARDEVEPAVGHPLEHLGDLARAPDRPQPVVGHPDDPELALLLEHAGHHRLVALLEDVQRDQLGRAARRGPAGTAGSRAPAAPSPERTAGAQRSGAMAPPDLYLQRDQPPGVPPLHLTGERTLPDVPEENYWYRRHLVVYEWIAQRVPAAASSTWRAARATAPPCSRHGRGGRRRRRQPRGARARAAELHRRDACASSATWSSPGRGACDCVVFLQTIEHVQDPDAVLDRLRDLIGPRRRRLRLDAERAHARARGRRALRQPLARERVPARRSSARCARATSAHVELLGLFHARKLALHQLAIERAGWDAIHARLRHHEALLRPLHAGDRRARLRAAARRARRRAGLPRRLRP